MADIGSQRFDIDSTMDIPADGFRTTIDNSDLFLAAAEDDRIVLSAGFRDPAAPLDPPQTIRSIDGVVDEWEIEVTPDGIIGSARGRDRVADLLDRQFNKIFLIEQPDEDPGVEFAVGSFLASQIIREVAASAGLDLAYQCRDYELLEDFQASGRAFDIIRRLTEPWSQVPRFRVDIFVQGNVLFCRQRVDNPVPDFTFTVTDARIGRLTIRKRQQPRFATVTLSGKLAPRNLQETQGPGGAIIIRSGVVEEVELHETFDAAGKPRERVIVNKLIRMPDRIDLAYLKQTFDVTTATSKLIAEERVVKEYEDSRYIRAGPTNQPKLLRECRDRFGIDPDDPTKTFQQLEQIDKLWGYDEFGFQNIETEKTSTLDLDSGVFGETKRIIRTQREIEHLKTEVVQEIYDVDESGELTLRQIDTTIQAGLRPHGTRPPRSISSGGLSTDRTPQEQIQLVETISTDPKAIDARFSNRHMDEADLEFIMDQFRRASGDFEYEILVDFMHMPFLRKGSILSLTDLVAEDGFTPIPLDPALVIEHRLEFDESSEAARMVSSIRAVFWRDT